MRSISIRNLYDKKYKTFKLEGLWAGVMGEPTRNGIWIIYGNDKNGKTSFALRIANLLSQFEKVLYISAEEGTDKEFQNAAKRAGIAVNNKQINVAEYLTVEEIKDKIRHKKGANVVIIDNTTIYAEDFKGGVLKDLKNEFPNKLFIYLSHEDAGEPSNALGKLAKRLAKIIIHVQGLTADISGRCPGGTIAIDEQTAQLMWGVDVIKNQELKINN